MSRGVIFHCIDEFAGDSDLQLDCHAGGVGDAGLDTLRGGGFSALGHGAGTRDDGNLNQVGHRHRGGCKPCPGDVNNGNIVDNRGWALAIPS